MTFNRKLDDHRSKDLRIHCFYARPWGEAQRPVCFLVTPMDENNPPECMQVCWNWCCFNADGIDLIGVKAGHRPITLHDVIHELDINPFGESQSYLKIEHEYGPIPSRPHDTTQTEGQGDSDSEGQTIRSDGESFRPPGRNQRTLF